MAPRLTAARIVAGLAPVSSAACLTVTRRPWLHGADPTPSGRAPGCSIRPGGPGLLQLGRGIHDGRHSAVTAWLAGGALVRVVSSIAGHASATLTLDRYGHVLGDLQLAQEAMARSVKRSR